MKIEFKAQRVDNKEWVYGDLVHNSVNAFSKIIAVGIKENDCYPVEVMPETVCQYFNIKDKHGKKVYDNDIIKASFYFENNHIVNFPKDIYCFMEYIGHSIFDGSICEEIEVIGNKFDEKELN